MYVCRFVYLHLYTVCYKTIALFPTLVIAHAEYLRGGLWSYYSNLHTTAGHLRFELQSVWYPQRDSRYANYSVQEMVVLPEWNWEMLKFQFQNSEPLTATAGKFIINFGDNSTTPRQFVDQFVWWVCQTGSISDDIARTVGSTPTDIY